MNRYHDLREDNDSGRTAGGEDRQPYSGNPYGYYPGQRSQHFGQRYENGPRRDWRDHPEQRYGQREPYNARWDNRYDSSRYSESQYGTPYGAERGRDFRSDRDFRNERESYRADQDRSDRWDDTGSGTRESSSRNFGRGPFSDPTESPGYFGTGYYGDGGAGYGGGFDQRRRTGHYGSLDHDPLEWRGRNEARHEERSPDQQRYRTGPKGYTRSDDRLREDISERLMIADSIDSSDVSVTVKDAKVTLEGRVPDRRMKHSIEDLVDQCPGVQDIDNRIRVGRADSMNESTSATSTTARQSTQATTSKRF
jgi:osmotically-inducible protein OsmY